ncbi:MAG: glycoside hydrolase 43 family protein [Bacteroidota bacterium]|jgi:beta-xylosidase|nr:glycoside hydrolase 43 family protein [Bacteroidota bacterium]HHU97530.1 glycosyl hydrolase 43 family protein [Petrimonas sp.]
MKQLFTSPLLLLIFLLFIGCQSSGNDKVLPTNPTIWADVPDAAMVRVGDTYYMSSTTMHMSPGLPIMKSNNLVNWELVSYAYDTLADNEMLRLENGRNAYGAGSWASCIRYHDGLYYVSTFSATSGKTHIYITDNIEEGEWKEITFEPVLHDHTLFFNDDGKVYMIYGAGNIRIAELEPDLSGIKEGGLHEVLIPDASKVASERVGLPAEGSQMYKHNGYYYLFNITWPPRDMRTVIVHRAKEITGPYEGRVVLRDRGIAQGSIIDTPEGDWYAYMFRDYGSVGRIPYLMPVTWEDDWPVLGVDGVVPDTLNIPVESQMGAQGIVTSDEFDRAPDDELLPLAWQWNHNPDHRYWSLTDAPGFLRLTTGRVDSSPLQARNTLTQRTFGPECAASTFVEISNMKNGDYAGMIALQRRYGFVGVKKEEDRYTIVMINGEGDEPVEVASVPLDQNGIHLKIECDFKERADKAYFFYSLDGATWVAIGNTLQMAYTLPHFMGYRFGLIHYATKETGGYTDFDYYRLEEPNQDK